MTMAVGAEAYSADWLPVTARGITFTKPKCEDLTKRAEDMAAQISGGTFTDLLARDIKNVLADPSVRAVAENRGVSVKKVLKDIWKKGNICPYFLLSFWLDTLLQIY